MVVPSAGSDHSNQDSTEQVVLKGGRANAGQVLRIGAEVARPVYPQTASVSHFLTFLIESGVSFVPRPIGFDDAGRQRLTFIPGVAPTPPYPDWAFSEELLVDVAIHQRRLHDAARTYVAETDAVWAVSAGDYFPEAALQSTELVVAHNDLGMSNTIVEDGQLVGFIDFDYCRPVDPLFDIAVAARHWAPFGDLDLADDRELNRVRRFRLFCDAHSLSDEQRASVVGLAAAFLDKARSNIVALAAAGQIGFQTLLANGYESTNRATVQWILDNAQQLRRIS